MSGYINGKVEIWYGDSAPSNQNILWQKRIITDGVESTIMYEFNNNTGEWQIHNINAINQEGAPIENPDGGQNNYAPINNAELTGTLTLNGIEVSVNLNGSNYVMVYGVGTPEENAAELLTAYEAAKNMPRYLGEMTINPELNFYKGQTVYDSDGSFYLRITEDFVGNLNGIPPLSTEITEAEAKSVRTTVIVAPGKYTFDNVNDFTIDTPSVDIVSLTGNRDVQINGIKVTAGKNVLIKGIDCGTNAIQLSNCIDNTLVFKNCKGGDNSFNTLTGNLIGTFIDCEAGSYSFNAVNVINTIGGTILTNTKFIKCISGDYSFGFNSIVSNNVLFEDCIGGSYSFSANNIDFTNQGNWSDFITTGGIYNRCVGKHWSFGYRRQLTGAILTDCTSGNRSFGSTNSVVEGYVFQHSNTKFIRCTAGLDSFCKNTSIYHGNSNEETHFIDCIGGDNSFFSKDSSSEETIQVYDGLTKFVNCIGGANSFFYKISFDSSTGSLEHVFMENCIGGDNSFFYDTNDNSSTLTEITISKCTGGINSFFFGQTSPGSKLYYCIGGNGSNIISSAKHLFCVVNDVAVANN